LKQIQVMANVGDQGEKVADLDYNLCQGNEVDQNPRNGKKIGDRGKNGKKNKVQGKNQIQGVIP